MTDFPDIIKTEITSTETDAFWNKPTDTPDKPTPYNTLIISQPYLQFAPEEQQLNKILDACKIKSDSCRIVQLETGEKVGWHHLKHAYQPKVVILFGIHPKLLGISALFRLNATNTFDTASWVPTLSLNELELQPQAKKDLWVNALKPLFADN